MSFDKLEIKKKVRNPEIQQKKKTFFFGQTEWLAQIANAITRDIQYRKLTLAIEDMLSNKDHKY